MEKDEKNIKDIKNIKETDEYIQNLREQIKRYNLYYYDKNESLISDIEYDNLLKELEKLEKLREPEELSPTKTVGNEVKSNKFQKVEHREPMLSLTNSYNEKDISDFIVRAQKILGSSKDLNFVLELKLDGLSISVIYEDGKLVKAVTRGDGYIGEDVTENIMQITSIPKILPHKISIEVRGEVVLPLSSFNKLNKIRLKNGEELFANPRNAASGTLRQLDANIVKERELDAYFYFLVDSEKYNLDSHLESIDFIEKLGLKTTGVFEILSDSSEIIERIDHWKELRKDLDYETDGLVIKINQIEYWKELGSTSKSPRWATAYKFPANNITTIIEGISWQVGRTGKITPVAHLKEVELSGSKIKRASLHNFSEIQRKDIRIGDTVFIEKAAEIIPQVIKSVKEVRNGSEISITEPTNCPVCNSLLDKDEEFVDIKCVNMNCKGRIKAEIEYFVARDALNIKGLGAKLVEKLIDLKYIVKSSDIFNLYEHKEELIKLKKLGEKSINNLFESIEESKNTSYSKIIYSLGIPFVGKYVAKLLADNSQNIETLLQMSVEDLTNIDGIGEKGAISIYNFFQDKKNIDTILELQKHGLKFYNNIKEIDNSNKLLTGKTFLCTGTLTKFTREEAKDIIEENGGTMLSAISKKLNYLIVGEKAGSKLKKAREIETIEILNEQQFLELINNK